MKDIKKEFSLFAPFYKNRADLVKYFEEHAEKGWMLEKITQFHFVFRRCQPKKLHFSVIYLKTVTGFDPPLTDSQQSLIDFCEHAGWVFAASNGAQQVFYSEEDDPCPIETDPMTEIAAYHGAMKKSVLPLYRTLSALTAINIYTNLYSAMSSPVDLVRAGSRLIAVLMYCIALCLMLFRLAEYDIWHRRAVKTAESSGIFLERPSRQTAYLWYLLCYIAALFFSMIGVTSLLSFLWVLGSIILGSIGITHVIECLKKKNVKPAVNIFTAVCLGILLIPLAVYPAYRLADISGEEAVYETYEYREKTHKRYLDRLPLTVEDLTDTGDARYSYQIRNQYSSVLGSEFTGQQYLILGEENGAELVYTVTGIRFSFMQDLFVRTALRNLKEQDAYSLPENETEDSWLSLDPEPWGADNVFRMRLEDGEWRSTYLICYPDRIIEIKFWGFLPQGPDAEQMAAVREKLGGIVPED